MAGSRAGWAGGLARIDVKAQACKCTPHMSSAAFVATAAMVLSFTSIITLTSANAPHELRRVACNVGRVEITLRVHVALGVASSATVVLERRPRGVAPSSARGTRVLLSYALVLSHDTARARRGALFRVTPRAAHLANRVRDLEPAARTRLAREV